MYFKKLCFATLLLLVIFNHVTGKKIKKNKRPKEQEESNTAEPNVVAYSTFGFNDVASYDGFVPTSPEYSSFLTGGNQESSTRLYAPAFPSAADSTGYSNNFELHSLNGQTSGVSEDDVNHSGMFQYSSNSGNYLSPVKYATSERNKNNVYENINNQSAESVDAPLYGTKINTKYKNSLTLPHSNSEYETNNNLYSRPSPEKYVNFQENKQSQEKPVFSELNTSYQNTNSHSSSFATQETDVLDNKHKVVNGNSLINFPRIVDFTNLGTKNYPTELDTSKIISHNMQHLSPEMSISDLQIDNGFLNTYTNNKIIDNSPTRLEEQFSLKNNEAVNKNVFKSNTFFDSITNKHTASHYKDNESTTKKPEPKKKRIYKPAGNYSNAGKDWKDMKLSPSPLKGYEYSTNFSNMYFRYDANEPKKPLNSDELVPASSNLVDLSSYKFIENDFNNFKKMPKLNNDEEYVDESSFKEKYKHGDYINEFKNSFNNVQTTTSSYWGNDFHDTDYSHFRNRPRKPQYAVTEINHDNIVNIPKKPFRLNFNKVTQNKQLGWNPGHNSQQILNKPTHDWTKDFLDTRYKSEEDLLGLRTHDTSHPTYLPTYKPSSNVDNDDEFKLLVEKWKQSYLKTKYKNEPVRDYESYGSEIKPYHVAISKPYPVTVPVEKPYPVHVPYIRPVLHHMKPVYEDPEHLDDYDYPRRPENQKPSHYKKRTVYGSRSKSRRPTRTSYPERNRRRLPDQRRPSGSSSEYKHSSRPSSFQHSSRYRYPSSEHHIDEDEYEYRMYCRKTGNC